MAKIQPEEGARRIVIVRAFASFVCFVIIFQLFARAVTNHDTSLALAKRQHVTRQEIVPRRGTIYATTVDGLYALATTDEKFKIDVIPKNVKDKTAAAKLLAEALGMDEKEIFSKIDNDKPYLPPIAQRVDNDKAQKIIDAKMVGVAATPEYVRFYPENNLASHILGFVNYENKGNYGVEGYYDDELKGFAGSIVGEKDNRGRLISILKQQSLAKEGDTLVLTIDQNVQYVAEQKLKDAQEKYGASGGQIIVIDVKTGAIVALASSPSFDPNNFNEVKAEEQTVFSNPVFGEVYEPGSIMKPIIVAIALDNEKVKPDDEGVFTNSVTVQGYTIHTSEDKTYGKENITQILENSDNVAMVWIADKIGNDLMRDSLEKFGFGAKIGVDSSGETTGKLLEKKRWRDINRATISFGQGVSVTPLQMAMSYQAIGNDGKLVLPHLVSKIIKPDGTERVIEKKDLRQVIKPEVAEQVRQMLISVVVRGHGKKAAVEGYNIGGKTGTAQIPNKDKSGYEENAHIGSFAGLVPADDPRFAMLVKLDRPTNVEFAEASAAPTFGEVAKFLLQYYQVPKSEN